MQNGQFIRTSSPDEIGFMFRKPEFSERAAIPYFFNEMCMSYRSCLNAIDETIMSLSLTNTMNKLIIAL